MMPHTPPEPEDVLQAQMEATGPEEEQTPQEEEEEEEEEASSFMTAPNLREALVRLIGAIVRRTTEELCNQNREALRVQNDEVLQLALQNEALALVPFLLENYNSCQPVSDVDLLSRITGEYRRYFTMILEKASWCTQLLFGIELREADPFFHTRMLVIAAGITYDGILSHVQGMPKTGLLIIILGIIFTEGGRATEEAIWQVLEKMDIYPDVEHFIYGIPRKLLREDFVIEKYLECHQVVHSDTTGYEFRWGPRAYAETTPMQVFEHWAKNSGIDPSRIASLYQEALQEEQAANAEAMASSIEE
ncbi:melanoma-associated antigen 10-like [Perognathus longimembris pacificus]|uniref:melanoma-associated antigen 10-like n=1 Tax=Perognathus longimembris pacificus TaxID=214514 RepID=UPI0020188E1E|nr:melanoma-associated antigen 10-like [Perognathus longimembris pacificus]